MVLDAPKKHPKLNMPATPPNPYYKRAAHPGLKQNAYLPTPPLPTPNVGALHPYPGACTQPWGGEEPEDVNCRARPHHHL